MSKEEALVELGKWYFKLYGPAAFEDFTWWTGLTVTACRLAFNSIKVLFHFFNIIIIILIILLFLPGLVFTVII